jgi:hypothetical protein
MSRFVAISATAGLLVPFVLLLLDRVAGPTINAFPYAMLFFVWPTCFMMWMVSSDWFGAGVFGLSVAVNCVLYAGLARMLWALRSLVRH